MIYAVIMCGGKGTRFWPRSIRKKPKQFHSIVGDKSMLRQTVNRLMPLIGKKNIIIIGNKDQECLVKKELPDIPKNNIISEPVGRNTAACLGLASVIVRKRDPNAVLVAVPADSAIKNEKKFIRIIKSAVLFAKKNDAFVTLGIKPRTPETGYGYVEAKSKMARSSGVPLYEVKKFVEKPNKQKAKKYVSSGNYYWNSGMFIFNVNTLLAAIAEQMADLNKGLIEIEKHLGKKDEKRVIGNIYRKLKPISIDYGVMEKVKNVVVLPADIGWSDVGSWKTLQELKKKDRQNNVMSGKTIAIRSEGNIVEAQSKLIALLGVKDLIVVESDAALLVAHKDSSQEVKEIVEKLEKENKMRYL